VITIALIYFLINYVSYVEIYSVFMKSNKIYILFVFLLMFLNIYLQFLKWKVVCNTLLNVTDNKKIWKSLFYGFSAGILTPVRVGEYLGRKFALEDTSLLKVTISTIIEKFASLFIVILVGGILAIIFIYNYYSFILTIPIALLIFVTIVLALLIYRGHNFSSTTFDRLSLKYNFFKNLKLELNYVEELRGEPVKLLFKYSSIFYFIIILQYGLLAKSFDHGGNLLFFIGAGSIVLFVKSLFSFLSFADLGIRESTSVFLLDKMGYTRAVGFNSAIFLFLFNLVIPSVFGMILLLTREKE